ncbi:nicotinate phosphoribosyltransferase [Corallococcus sp. H22C18031201]|uniref:nicotinate phosphoribosyltransferase n=1 Tax=Citreicoccus inhibens TaxID=2849499 RepID=UPI000E75DBB9|nr:nicotinate phosphoribosyltransferase [Citreicoccus inhibens]MBU8896751.1 nicotinate phosphoribosyltransferase [Citreicoccus inhibens]RJS21951.1 nicotinate phosphoribosyltransferase [Corallococcus sp. H22C18031201]
MEEDTALLLDLYELTMADAYLAEGMEASATFSLFVRVLPPQRNYLLAAGLEDALDYLESLRFGSAALEWLDSRGLFSRRLLDWMERFRFTGDVDAMPEGTPVFAEEPLLEVTAPLPMAQLVETVLINQVHLQTMAASKASRVVQAAAGRPVVDFGLRRMHGIDAGMKVARAAFIAGVTGTSNVAAGWRYGIPLSGTLAHSYVQAHEDEDEAFRAFTRRYPEATLLVDTYDTLRGVRRVVRLAQAQRESFHVRAMRLDSGDLLTLSREARRILDDAGLTRIQLVASGGLDEDSVARLVASDAPINAFGVGTAMGVSKDAPALDMAYKLVTYADRDRTKLSAAKVLHPGRKQVFRREEDGSAKHDTLTRRGHEAAGRPLLRPVMRAGKRLPETSPPLPHIQAHARHEVATLPPRLLELTPASPPYRVNVAPELAQALARLEADWAAAP